MIPMETDPDSKAGKHEDLTEQSKGTFHGVYNELGYGFLESACCEAMRMALTQIGLRIET
jgi:hypothetical protein